MYKITLYDKSFNTITTLLNTNFYDVEYSSELNKAGGASFKIRVLDPKATLTNLQLYNRIRIYKGSDIKFTGFIEDLESTATEITVNCIGMLGLFKKRLTSRNINSGSASTELYNILTDTNALDDTIITQGITNVSYTITEVEFSRSSVFSAWDKIAKMSDNAEFKINQVTLALDFKQSIGTDKSASIILQYNINQVARANLFNFDVKVDGGDMVNSVTGVGKSSITSTKSDATSKTKYGLLEDTENFSQTVDVTDLGNEAQNFLDEHKVEFYVPKLKIDTSKIDHELFDTGDIINVYLNNGFISFNQSVRIMKKEITINETGTEEVEIKIVSEDLKTLPAEPIIGDIDYLKKQVALLNGQI